MAVGRLFLCLFLIVKVTDDVCRNNISTYAACNSNKEIDNVGHDSTSSLSEGIYINWTLLFRCDSITAYYPSHLAEMKWWCLSACLYYPIIRQFVNCENECSTSIAYPVFFLHDENLQYRTLPFFIQDERPIRHDGGNLTSSIPKIIRTKNRKNSRQKREEYYWAVPEPVRDCSGPPKNAQIYATFKT